MQPLEDQLKKYFGFDRFIKGQQSVIEKLVSGQSAGAIFPTGSGKSLCYQLPALLLDGLTLVVSPLLSLMKDQIDFLHSRNIPAARLDSTLDRDKYNQILDDAKNGRLKILIIAVERFKNERFRFQLSRMNLSMLAVDEAHCISEWGHNFRPEYLKLPTYRQEFKIPQVLMLTATATHRVIDDMCTQFQVPRENVIVTGFYRKNLFLRVTPTTAENRESHLLKRISESPEASTIVYVTLQKTAEQVARFLKANGIRAMPYHAGMSNDDRESIQNRFMRGEIHCVVATIAFGMGIDKKDIRRVVHHDMPKSIENYSQEIGRSGRDGKPALCEVLASRDNLPVLENFIYGDTPDKIAVHNLIECIHNYQNIHWEVRLTALSNELNIRMLPLKTLLVYLEMEGILQPKYAYFNEYAFKYLKKPEEIVGIFNGERHRFVQTIFAHCDTKKTWTYVDTSAILKAYSADRKRLVAALEYFDEQGWILLKARQTTEVFEIVNQNFDSEHVTEKLHQRFKDKQAAEIHRIEDMVNFFESESCLSGKLSDYFGENMSFSNCGHCSVCQNGKSIISRSSGLRPLEEYNFKKVSEEFKTVMENQISAAHLTRFLCGINTPIFTKMKIKTLSNFGILENHPFPEVKSWVKQHRPGSQGTD